MRGSPRKVILKMVERGKNSRDISKVDLTVFNDHLDTWNESEEI